MTGPEVSVDSPSPVEPTIKNRKLVSSVARSNPTAQKEVHNLPGVQKPLSYFPVNVPAGNVENEEGTGPTMSTEEALGDPIVDETKMREEGIFES